MTFSRLRLVVSVMTIATISHTVLSANQRPQVIENDGTKEDSAILCSDLAGSIVHAPHWFVGTDGASNQQVLLHFKGEREVSKVTWLSRGKPYYESPGVGFQMSAGFAILVVEEDRGRDVCLQRRNNGPSVCYYPFGQRTSPLTA